MRVELEDFKVDIREDTKQNVILAKNMLEEMATDLEHTAQEIEKYDDLWSPEVKQVVEFSQNINVFDATCIADPKGHGYAHTGYEFSVADMEFFQRAIETREVVFSEVLPSKRFEATQIIAFPMMTENGEIKGVLFGLFDIETFSNLLNTVVHHDERIYVVDSNGT